MITPGAFGGSVYAQGLIMRANVRGDVPSSGLVKPQGRDEGWGSAKPEGRGPFISVRARPLGPHPAVNRVQNRTLQPLWNRLWHVLGQNSVWRDLKHESTVDVRRY